MDKEIYLWDFANLVSCVAEEDEKFLKNLKNCDMNLAIGIGSGNCRWTPFILKFFKINLCGYISSTKPIVESDTNSITRYKKYCKHPIQYKYGKRLLWQYYYYIPR